MSVTDGVAPDVMAGEAQWRDRIVGEGWEDPQQLLANPKNFRIHPKAQQDALEAVLSAVGWIQRIIVNRATGFVVDGHLRVSLAISRNEPRVPVLYVELTPDEEDLALATLDPLSAMAATDREKLSELLAGVRSDDQRMTDLLANIRETARIVAVSQPGNTDPDATPEQRPTRIKQGELFQLGSHRLLCGDCTQADDVARLMGDSRAGLMNIDPPYGVGYANDERPNPGVAKPRVANDALKDARLQAFLESAFRPATTAALTSNAAWYLWHAHLTQGFFAAAAAAAAANVVLHRQIIWVKPVLLLGRGQYHWKHEPCFMGWVEGHQPPDYGLGHGERTQTTVWEVASVTQAERKEFNHSTPKPVGLFTIPLIKHLRDGEIAYDPFAGSGPQLIAAEQLQRRCFAMDIDPACCQVIIDRWEAFTGKKAVLLSRGAISSKRKPKKASKKRRVA